MCAADLNSQWDILESTKDETDQLYCTYIYTRYLFCSKCNFTCGHVFTNVSIRIWIHQFSISALFRKRKTAHCIKNPAFILKAAPPHSRLASILAQLAWRSGEPNGGRADQFGATAVDRDYAATLIAASVRNCGLRHRRTSRLTGRLSALTRYRRAASIAPGLLQTSLSLCSLAPFFPFFFFCADAGFCK